MLEIFLALFTLAIVVCVTTIFYERYTLISATPILPWTRWQVVSLLKEFQLIETQKKIADLGCGWGGMVGKLSHMYPLDKITGYELSPFPFIFSKLRFAGRSKNILILKSNFFLEDLSDFDIIFCYLSPNLMEQLKPQLSNLKTGSIVISCSFPILEWKPYAERSVWSFVKIPVYLYKIGTEK